MWVMSLNVIIPCALHTRNVAVHTKSTPPLRTHTAAYLVVIPCIRSFVRFIRQVRILSVDNSSCVGYSSDTWNWDMLRTFSCERGQIGVAEDTKVGWEGKDVIWNVVRGVQRLEPIINGASLGGWLVLEKWMTPEIFKAGAEEAEDQWSWSEILGYERAQVGILPDERL